MDDVIYEQPLIWTRLEKIKRRQRKIEHVQIIVFSGINISNVLSANSTTTFYQGFSCFIHLKYYTSFRLTFRNIYILVVKWLGGLFCSHLCGWPIPLLMYDDLWQVGDNGKSRRAAFSCNNHQHLKHATFVQPLWRYLILLEPSKNTILLLLVLTPSARGHVLYISWIRMRCMGVVQILSPAVNWLIVKS